MTEQEKHLPQTNTTETAPAANGETGKKPGLMRGARDFIENTWSSLKGKDLNQAVEEFTSEMTLVAEGLSEDQNALRRDGEKLAARMDKLAERQKIGEDSVKALQDQLEQDYPTLTRPIFFCYRKYNMDLTTGSLLFEVGSNANTLEESIYTANLVGKSLGKLLAPVKEK